MKKKTKRTLKKALHTFQKNNVIGGEKSETLREREKRAVIKGKVRRAALYSY